ncbi:MAG: hypothetical protein EOP04_08990, partial [Proteobacteria bacterium]
MKIVQWAFGLPIAAICVVAFNNCGGFLSGAGGGFNADTFVNSVISSSTQTLVEATPPLAYADIKNLENAQPEIQKLIYQAVSLQSPVEIRLAPITYRLVCESRR